MKKLVASIIGGVMLMVALASALEPSYLVRTNAVNTISTSSNTVAAVLLSSTGSVFNGYLRGPVTLVNTSVTKIDIYTTYAGGTAVTNLIGTVASAGSVTFGSYTAPDLTGLSLFGRGESNLVVSPLQVREEFLGPVSGQTPRFN